MAAEKASVRKELLARRDAIPPEVRRAKGRIIRDHLLSLDEFSRAMVPLLFASFKTEVDTMPLISHFLESSRPVVLPVVDRSDHRLVLYEIRSLEELRRSYMGIPEPSVVTEDRLRDINETDMVLMPGAGFDASGGRLGYGGAYYDRLLSGLINDIPLIAVAYEEQIVDEIPTESHDFKVKIIVTDRRVIRCSD